MESSPETKHWNGGIFVAKGPQPRYTPNVGLGEFGRYTPLPTAAGAPELNQVFISGLQSLNANDVPPFEKALGFFLFGALQ